MSASQDVLYEEITGRQGNLGVITLNRPQVLNALNQNMLHSINYQLSEWASAEQIKAVVIRAAEGRAFCAGADIRSIYEKKMENDLLLPYFFRDEYQLNLRIHHYPKPYIAFLRGITMGGGAGISVHGSYRVGTPNLVFSMPETGIGFFPDAGATFFLSRLPCKMGFYLGLTGAAIPYDDCAMLGLVDLVISDESFPKLLYALADAPLIENSNLAISERLQQFAVPFPESDLLKHASEIETCFSAETVEEIFKKLEENGSEWCKQTAIDMRKKSPLSLKITLRALQEGACLDVEDCMRMEYRLANRFIEGKDFFEGIRAAIIEKNQKPEWEFTQLEDVPSGLVDNYFLPLQQELI